MSRTQTVQGEPRPRETSFPHCLDADDSRFSKMLSPSPSPLPRWGAESLFNTPMSHTSPHLRPRAASCSPPQFTATPPPRRSKTKRCGTWDPLLQCWHLDTPLPEPQNTKKLYGTKNNGMPGQLGQIMNRKIQKTKKPSHHF